MIESKEAQEAIEQMADENHDPHDRRLSLPLTDTELPRISIGPMNSETKRWHHIALTILVVFSFMTVAWIASPLWVGIALGTIMAFTAQPIYRRISTRIHSRVGSAAILTGVTGLASAAILTTTIYVITNELFDVAAGFQSKIARGSLGELIGERNARLAEHLGFHRAELMDRIRKELGVVVEYATRAVGVILETTTGATLGLIIALMTMYYVLLEWAHIAVRLERLLPLDPRHTRALILEFRDVGRSSFIGTIATALVQGLLAGIGFGITGVPNAITFAMLTALASFIPLVGTAMVWGPVAIYMAATDHLLGGVFIAIWGLIVVMAMADYVIRPRLVGSKGGGHPLLMLIALLGGIEVFGLAGLFVGPILMSLFLATLRIYEREMEIQAALDPPPPRRRATDRNRTDVTPVVEAALTPAPTSSSITRS
ncbi:MAG: AI-2E family transporter [Polyangiaceae bacterium]